MRNKKIYTMEIPQSQTECSLYNSISGATDYCTVCTLYSVHFNLHQGCPDRGPRAQIWARDRLVLGPLGL